MQDPVHYPHGSSFLAPGPLGLCHGIPNDPRLKGAMQKAAVMQQRIHDMYNVPEVAESGSVLEKAMKHWKKKQARKNKAEEKKLLREQQKLRRVEVEESKERNGKSEKSEKSERRAEESAEEEEAIDDDDLVASVSVGLQRGVRAMCARWEQFHRGMNRALPRKSL
jgi:hypothetical protein